MNIAQHEGEELPLNCDIKTIQQRVNSSEIPKGGNNYYNLKLHLK